MANTDDSNFKINNFKYDSIPIGYKGIVHLQIKSESIDQLTIPMFVIKGTKPGKTIGVFGGVHGDEYEGPQAIRDIYNTFEPEDLAGTILGVPHCNIPAFSAGTRISPIDGLNLARIFPGNKHGSVTEIIANCLGSSVISYTDFFIDLHSSGSHMSMPLLVGYYSGSNQIGITSKKAAFNFGAPVVWGHTEISIGRTISYAHNLGIPWLYTECPGGGWLNLQQVEKYVSGVKNVMQMLEIISASHKPFEPKHHLIGSGDVDKSIIAKTAGYLLPNVNLLQKVEKGQELAKIIDLTGIELDKITANSSGVVICMRKTPSVKSGDQIFLITSIDKTYYGE